MIYTISRLIAALILRCGYRVKVYGYENLPRDQAFILASNHQSFLDPLVLGVICRRRLNYMARHDLFSNKIFAKYLSSLGVFPVKRNNVDSYALKEALRRLGRGKPLLVFPEGSRQDSQARIIPQPGIGFLAAKAKVPVIPVRIKGTEIALPRGAKFLRPARICIYFGEQIYIERRAPYQDIANLIMDKIRQLS